MRPLTILFNTYSVAFDCPGGGEVQLLRSMEELEQLGARVLRYDPWRCREQFGQADVVHYFSVQGGSWRFCGHVREVRRLPLVISPIVWIDDPARYGMADIAATLGHASRILPNSRAECEQLARLFALPPERFTPVVNGVDEIFFEKADPAVFRAFLRLDAPFVLCMGNIERRKNQLSLIRAMRGTGLHLVLAGQEREADYAAMCRAEADDTVHFAGMLEHAGLLQRSAYAAAAALALPSTLETPGLAALEAGAAGCSLAVTRVGCTQEYFGEYAVYCDPCDVRDIRDAVLRAARTTAGRELARRIGDRFTWRHAARQLFDVYSRCVPSGHV